MAAAAVVLPAAKMHEASNSCADKGKGVGGAGGMRHERGLPGGGRGPGEMEQGGATQLMAFSPPYLRPAHTSRCASNPLF